MATGVALLLVHAGVGAVTAGAAVTTAQKLGSTRWSVEGVSALDGLGSIVAVAQVPAAQPGQSTENRWSLAHAFSFTADNRAFGVISLDTDGTKRYASLALNTGTAVAGARRVEFNWQPGKAYLPLAVISGGSLFGFVHDFSTSTWSPIGAIPLSASYGRLSPVSTTYLWWYGATQPDCASYPRVDHYRYTPLGVVNGNPRSIPSTALANDVGGTGCPVAVTTDPDPSWRRYVAGTAHGPVVEWASANHDHANTRESTLSAINSQNVGSLAMAWSAPASGWGYFGAMGGMNPVVVDGTAYYQDLLSNVYAVDARTGSPRWKRTYNAQNIGPNGPALEDGRVFAATSMNTVAALDAATGETLWSKTVANAATQGITTQIAVLDGTVYFSTVPAPSVTNLYPPGGMGILYALDAATGQEVWSFNTVKDGDLWGHPEVNSGGGSWYPPAIDRATGTTYWATGNPAPFPGTAEYPNGSSRPGENLYTNSMVAIDSRGNLVWYHQVTPHDLFDYDFEASPVLTTATIGGVARRVVVGAGKAGRVLAFDATSGAVLWDVKVGVHQNDDLTSIPEGTTIGISPGFVGGVMSPMALSEGVVYVPVANTQASYTSTSHTATIGGTGELVALDVRSGQTLWKANLDAPVYAGATVVRDLVVTATAQGKVAAYQRTTGRLVWSWQAEAGVNAPLAVTGDSLLIPVGMGAAPKLVALRVR